MQKLRILSASLVLVAACALTSCISSLESAYDDHAREECDSQTSGSARSDCYDRVEQNRRDRR